MPPIFKIAGPNKLEALPPVHCLNEGKELQDLLLKNYALLAGDQINPESPRKWLLIRKEMPVVSPDSGENRWLIDFFFADQDGIPTFVECKRYQDTRSRREVIGQMMEYAANSQHYLDKNMIRDFAEKTAKKASNEINDLILNLLEEDDPGIDSYFEAIENNLKEGQIRLIFFLEEAPFELKSIVEFLNNQMERTEVLIIEAKLFSNGSERFVIPTLFGYTEQARRVKRVVTVSKSKRGRVALKWDKKALIGQLDNFGSEERKKNFLKILEIVESHTELFQCQYGSGKTGTIALKSNSNASLFHMHASGEFYLVAPHYLKSHKDQILALTQSFEEKGHWEFPLKNKQYISMDKKLEHLDDEGAAQLARFILELGKMIKGVEENEVD